MTTGRTSKFASGIGLGTVHSSVLAPQGFAGAIGAAAPGADDGVEQHQHAQPDDVGADAWRPGCATAKMLS